MPFEVSEDVLAERVGDLRVDPGVLNVLVAPVVGDALDAAAGVEQVYRDRVAERVNRTALDAGGPGVLFEEVLDLAPLQWPLAAGEEVGAGVVPHAEVRIARGASHRRGRSSTGGS